MRLFGLPPFIPNFWQPLLGCLIACMALGPGNAGAQASRPPNKVGPLGPPIGEPPPPSQKKQGAAAKPSAPLSGQPRQSPTQPVRAPLVRTSVPSGGFGQPIAAPTNLDDRRLSSFGQGDNSAGIEMSLWPEDMEIADGSLQWRVNIVRFSPGISSQYRTPVRPDGFITGVGSVAATMSLTPNGTCTSVLSIAGSPMATIEVACSRGPGLMFRVIKPPRPTRWVALSAVFRETEGSPTVVREYLADLWTHKAWPVTDFATEGFAVGSCNDEARLLWNSDSARRLGLSINQCLSIDFWPQDRDRLAGSRSADTSLQDAVERQPDQQVQSPTPEENAAWIEGYGDTFRGGEVTVTTRALARERNYPTSDGSNVLRELQAGTTIRGRWVLGRDPTARWLKRTGTGGYVWEGNLTEGTTISPPTPTPIRTPSPSLAPSLSPTTQITSENIDAGLAQALRDSAPELAGYLEDKIVKMALKEAFRFIVRNGNLTMKDFSDFFTGYLQSSGYRNGINKLLANRGSLVAREMAFDMFLDVGGNIAYSVAKRNGASDWSAEFDKQLTKSVATGLILGPQAQLKKAAKDIVESGVLLTINTVRNFNQQMSNYAQVADSADEAARQAMAAGDRIRYMRMLSISNGARQAIAGMYAHHPIIATMSEIPSTIKSLIPH